MFHKALLLFLPAVAYAQINIRAEFGLNGEEHHPSYSGSIVDVISDTERETWHISDEVLKETARAIYGERPNDIHVRSPPDPIYDEESETYSYLHERHGWQEVHRHLTVDSMHVLGIKYESVILASEKIINTSPIPVTYHASFKQFVEETITNTWRTDGELTVSQDISYSFLVRTLPSPTNLSFTRPWGDSMSTSKRVKLGFESGSNITLQPGESVDAALKAYKGSIEVHLRFVATLQGNVACFYAREPNGSYYLGPEINSCLRETTMHKIFYSSEVINIVFYADAKVVL